MLHTFFLLDHWSSSYWFIKVLYMAIKSACVICPTHIVSSVVFIISLCWGHSFCRKEWFSYYILKHSIFVFYNFQVLCLGLKGFTHSRVIFKNLSGTFTVCFPVGIFDSFGIYFGKGSVYVISFVIFSQTVSQLIQHELKNNSSFPHCSECHLYHISNSHKYLHHISSLVCSVNSPVHSWVGTNLS